MLPLPLRVLAGARNKFWGEFASIISFQRQWSVILCGLFLGTAAQAFTVVAPTFHQLVDGADQILRVRVETVAPEWEEVDGRRIIRTRVQCEVLKTLKGAEQASIALMFLGGQIGTAKLLIPDMPKLEVGERYVVFLKNNGRAVCPLLAVMHGSYRLQRDAASGTDRVLRSNGMPLTSAAEISQPLAEKEGQKRALADALTAVEFETEILNRLRDARAK